MRNYFLGILAVSILSFSCESDDDNRANDPNEPEIENPTEGEVPVEMETLIRISVVDTEKDEVVLTNLGGNTVDISGYFLCLGPGTYKEIGTITTANTNLTNGESITLSYDMNPVADGLSIFSAGSFSSSDPTILVDYVQWGTGDQARVSQAVTAGRWDSASNFVELGSPYSFNGEADEFGVSFWQN